MENIEIEGILGNKTPTFIGVIMAVVGSVLVGFSYTASKNAHNKALVDIRKQQRLQNNSTDKVLNDEEQSLLDQTFTDSKDTIVVEDDYDGIEPLIEYSMSNTMKQPGWWFSIILLLLGEIFNFMAYGFAPTSVIAPLGTMSIISGALSGYFYLGERINVRSVLGMMVSIIGATLIVLFAKSEEPKLSPEDIIKAVSQPRFLIYLLTTASLACVLVVFDKMKFKNSVVTIGDRVMAIRVMLTAIFSGFTVLSTKSLSSLLSLTLYRMFGYWVSYIIILVLLVNALLTLYYTNKALSSFDSTSVLPAEFAAFTFSAVLGSAMLYNDFDHADAVDILMFLLGCFVTFFGVFLITTGNDKKGKPVNNRTSAIIPPAPIAAVENFSSLPSSSTRRLSHPYPRYRYSTFPQQQNRSTVFYNPRLSQNMISNQLINMLNALGNTRASLTFQQVVLPSPQSNQILVVSQQPLSHTNDPHLIQNTEPRSGLSFQSIHKAAQPDWGFEVVPTRTENDELAFFVRPFSSKASVASDHENEQQESVTEQHEIIVNIGGNHPDEISQVDTDVEVDGRSGTVVNTLEKKRKNKRRSLRSIQKLFSGKQ